MKTFLLIIVIIIVGVFLVRDGISRSEKEECIKWKSQAKEFPGFYLANWQKDQCVAHGIQIDAPVK